MLTASLVLAVACRPETSDVQPGALPPSAATASPTAKDTPDPDRSASGTAVRSVPAATPSKVTSGRGGVPQGKLPPVGVARGESYGTWQPGPHDSCSDALHDTFWVYGPDGKVYPTWHPPKTTDPVTGKTCTFGHEHGNSPAGSHISRINLPFGYINDTMTVHDPHHPRHEDHVGHKVEWINDRRQNDGSTCSSLVKLHQGTHSPDAFTNNMHELMYFVQCDNGLRVEKMGMQIFGGAGSMITSCGGDIDAGAFQPSTSPTGENESSRQIPATSCLPAAIDKIRQGEDASAEWYGALREHWITGQNMELHRDGDGNWNTCWGQRGCDRNAPRQFLFGTGTYFIVDLPSRAYEAGKEKNLAHLVDWCGIPELADKNHCAQIRGKDVAWDHPASPFKGTKRMTNFDATNIGNWTDQDHFYCNAMGTECLPEADPAKGVVVRQTIRLPKGMQTTQLHFARVDADYDDGSVHAPN